MVDVIAFDTETALIAPGLQAPPMACLTFEDTCDGKRSGHPEIVHQSEARPFIAGWLGSGAILVGHNVAFDFAVVCAKWPDLIPAVFAKYDRNQVTDTKIRQQLLDIAAGCFRGKMGDGNQWIQYGYSLNDLNHRIHGKRLDKDTWRIRYGEFIDVPLAEWPEGARQYPLEDARATLDAYLWQEPHADKYLKTQYREARAAFAFALASAWGLITDPQAVDEYEKQVRIEYEEVKAQLIGHGLVRKNGSRDTKAAKAYMARVCRDQNVEPIMTDGGEKGEPQISMSAEACDRVDDDVIEAYSDYQTLAKALSNDIVMLRGGCEQPLHPRYDLAESSRSTCSGPNIQALRRRKGIREAFRPRPGYVYAQADFSGLELHTMAQSCIDLFGESELAKALNAGRDAHLEIAALALHISYEEAERRLAAGDKEVKKYRSGAKPANFGFIDGIGTARYAEYAKKTYGVEIDNPFEIRAAWDERWPEMRLFFAWVNERMIGRKHYSVEHPRTGRTRSGIGYTKLCSNIHQELGAAAAKEALWRVQRACYAEPERALYGSHVVAFVHDEIIAEVPIERGHECAQELGKIMIDGASIYLPDVPPRLEPLLMSVWSKSAEPVYDENRRLVPWQPTKS